MNGQDMDTDNIPHRRELIIWGADIEVQDQDGRSALSVAVTCDSEAAAKLVTLLLDNGANPNLCDRDNMTPLLIAAFEGQIMMIYARIEYMSNYFCREGCCLRNSS